MLLITPLVLAWAAAPSPESRSVRTVESVGLALLQVLAYRLRVPDPVRPRRLPVPAAGNAGGHAPWALRWVALANLVTLGIAALGTGAGTGPFVHDPGIEALLHVQTFGIVASLTTLLVASLAAERRRIGFQFQETAERFRGLTALSSDWYWEQDENLRFTYVSDGYDDRAGLSGDASSRQDPLRDRQRRSSRRKSGPATRTTWPRAARSAIWNCAATTATATCASSPSAASRCSTSRGASAAIAASAATSRRRSWPSARCGRARRA